MNSPKIIKPENGPNYQINEDMNCASIDCILMCIMSVIMAIYLIYQWLNYLWFKEKILFYYFIQIIIGLRLLDHYYCQRMTLYTCCKLCAFAHYWILRVRTHGI